jgi:hypothetical protein
MIGALLIGGLATAFTWFAVWIVTDSLAEARHLAATLPARRAAEAVAADASRRANARTAWRRFAR